MASPIGGKCSARLTTRLPRNGLMKIGVAIADLWSAYLNYPVSPADTCHMMALLKIARLRNGKHRDSSVDAAGYLGLGFEVDS